MKSNTLILSLISFVLFASASAQKCYTVYWYKGGSGSVPTKTFTLPLKPTTITVTRTKTVIRTSTLPPGTNTVVVTETSTGVVVKTVTSTIPAPAGFTPVTESSGYTSANAAAKKKRAVLDILFNRQSSSSPPRYPKGYSPKGGYPKPKPVYVVCVVTTRSTITVKTKEKTTSTSIVVPSSVTETSTTVETTIETQTSTTSFYAACATNNILGPVVNEQGLYVQGVGNSDPNGIQQNFAAGGAYECCVACLTGSTGLDNCQNAIYDADSGICNPIGGNADACGPGGTQANPAGSYVLLTSTPNNRFDINGPCGYLNPAP